MLPEAVELGLESAWPWILLLIAIMAPWIVLVLGARAWRSQRARAWFLGLGILPAFLLMLGGVGLVMLRDPGPPGDTARARIAQRRAEPVLAALSEARLRLGTYRATLQELVPRFLPDSVLPRFHSVIGHPLTYEPRLAGDYYLLEFRFNGSGFNECWLSNIAEGHWECTGHK